MATEAVTSRQYLAVPFRKDFTNPTSERKNVALLNGLVSLPGIFPLPYTDDLKRIALASLLTDPDNVVWEVWQGGELIGVMLIDHLIPNLEGRAHFGFFDRQLWGKRDLVIKMMAWAFEALNLQRIDVEIPETIDTLIRFCRVKLGFRYPGEREASGHPIVPKIEEKLRINGAAQWVAKFGSRKEKAHWNGDKFVDVVCLRVLREEFVQDRITEAERAVRLATPASDIVEVA